MIGLVRFAVSARISSRKRKKRGHPWVRRLDMLEKNRIRERMRAERRKVAPSVRRSASQEVCARILDRADVRGALVAKQPFAVYLASPQEIDLASLIEHLWAADCPVRVPAWRNGSYALEPYSQKTTLISGPMGILEPAPQGSVPKVSGSVPNGPKGSVPKDSGSVPKVFVPGDSGSVPKVWIVPGLAFTRTGARLGYGGGWYDRLLAAADPSAVLLGVAYPFQMVEELPSEPHDIRLTDVVVAEGCA